MPERITVSRTVIHAGFRTVKFIQQLIHSCDAGFYRICSRKVHDDKEFISAGPAAGVADEYSAQNICEGCQETVTCRMTKLVIDFLQPVQIQTDQTEIVISV